MCVVWDCAGGSVFLWLVIAIVMKSWFLQMCFGGFPAMDCLYDGVVYHVFSRNYSGNRHWEKLAERALRVQK